MELIMHKQVIIIIAFMDSNLHVNVIRKENWGHQKNGRNNRSEWDLETMGSVSSNDRVLWGWCWEDTFEHEIIKNAAVFKDDRMGECLPEIKGKALFAVRKSGDREISYWKRLSISKNRQRAGYRRGPGNHVIKPSRANEKQVVQSVTGARRLEDVSDRHPGILEWWKGCLLLIQPDGVSALSKESSTKWDKSKKHSAPQEKQVLVSKRRQTMSSNRKCGV